MEREEWEKGKDGKRAGCQRRQDCGWCEMCKPRAGRGSQDEGEASLPHFHQQRPRWPASPAEIVSSRFNERHRPPTSKTVVESGCRRCSLLTFDFTHVRAYTDMATHKTMHTVNIEPGSRFQQNDNKQTNKISFYVLSLFGHVGIGGLWF